MGPRFIYCACQVGAEAALRQEIAGIDPSLRSAFARPGLVTFKLMSGPVEPAEEGISEAQAVSAVIRSASVLARACGASLGPASTAEQALEVIRSATQEGAELRLQVWERDRWRPGEEPPGFSYGQHSAEIRERLLAAWPDDRKLAVGPLAQVGEQVAEVIVGAPGEPWLVALRRQGPGELPYGGGRIPVEDEPRAPSRAYYKLCEGLVYADIPLRAGDVAVELGSAPGGASFALLRRGLEVHGVDPGAMDPLVLGYTGAGTKKNNRFVHHACTMGQVKRRDLPRALQWIVADVNLAPQIALQTVRRLAARPRPALCGVLLTLKIDNWKALRHLPGWLRQVEAMGMVEVGKTQLSRNRMEVFAYGLTRAGIHRRSSSSP